MHKLISFRPTHKAELSNWSDADKCETGPDVDDWGTDSDKCYKYFSNGGVWHTAKELTKMSHNNHFAHHTCVIKWRWGFNRQKTFLCLGCTSSSCTPYITLLNGTKLRRESKSRYTVDGDFGFFLKQKIIASTITLDCFEKHILSIGPRDQLGNIKDHDYYSDIYCHDPIHNQFFPVKKGTICLRSICYDNDHTHNFPEELRP